MLGSLPARGQARRYGGVGDDSSTATASEAESLEEPAPPAPAAAAWRRCALALGATLVAAALLRARWQSAQVGVPVAMMELAGESPQDCRVLEVGGRHYHVCRHRGCDNWRSLALTPNSSEVADLESCLDLCRGSALCGAANFQPDSCPGGQGIGAGACQLFKDGCAFGHNDCWDYYLPTTAVARMDMDPNTPSSTLNTAAKREDRYLDVKDKEKFHKGDWIYIVNQAVAPFESEEAQVESTSGGTLKLDRRVENYIYPAGSLVSVVPPIVPTAAPTPEPTAEPTGEPTPMPTTPAPTPAPTPLRAEVSMLIQAAHIGVQNLYVANPGHFQVGDIVEISSKSFRDLCNVTGVFEETLECKKGIEHAYPIGSPVVFIPLEGSPDADQPTHAPTEGSGVLLLGHARLTSNHPAGADRLYLSDNADFPDNCIIVLVNPSMQMVGRHLVKPGGATHRTVTITPVLGRDWPTGTTAAVVSSFTSATFLEADAAPSYDGTVAVQVAAATVFDVHDIVMVGSDDHAYAERREIINIEVNKTGEFLKLAPSGSEVSTRIKAYKAGTFLTNAQAQTILMAPAEKGDKHLQVDTDLFVEAGNEVQIDSGTGYSERAVVVTSGMTMVMEGKLTHSFPAGTAVTAVPPEEED